MPRLVVKKLTGDTLIFLICISSIVISRESNISAILYIWIGSRGTLLNAQHRFKIIPQGTKNTQDYYSYLVNMEDYLINWIIRAKPLFKYEEMQSTIKRQFDDLWKQGKVPLWERTEIPVDNSLYCRACDKHYAKKTVFDGHLSGKKHLKAQQTLDNGKCMEIYSFPTNL
jgi:Zinc-finger double-stranded RNA-binding